MKVVNTEGDINSVITVGIVWTNCESGGLVARHAAAARTRDKLRRSWRLNGRSTWPTLNNRLLLTLWVHLIVKVLTDWGRPAAGRS